jgi:acyl dehydratase
MLSVWFRPHHWAPGRPARAPSPLQIHFDLKEGLGLPEAVMSDNTIVFHDPGPPGDRLATRQILRSVSDEKTTKLGTGRFWVIDVEYHNQRGAWWRRESYTGFGYRRGMSPGTRHTGHGHPGHRQPVTVPVLLLGDVARGRPAARAGLPVTATTVVLGALAARDWRPMHHDKDFAVDRNGTRDIFLNTPNQAAWFERFLTDWTGPYGRLGG